MRTIFLALLVVAAACRKSPQPYHDWPDVPELPPPAPERFLRQPPDFSFRDYTQRKHYYLRFYSAPEVDEEVVTIVDEREPERGERLATLDEHDYAMTVFVEDWERKGLEEKLRHHKEIRDRERLRTATLLDERIRLTRLALAEIEDRKFELDAKLRARQATGHTPEGDPDSAFLAAESSRLQQDFYVREAELRLLEYWTWLRDREFTRASTDLVEEAFPLTDYRGVYKDPWDLVEEVKKNVRPEMWNRAHAKIEVRGDMIVIRCLRSVVEEVRGYLASLTARHAGMPNR